MPRGGGVTTKLGITPKKTFFQLPFKGSLVHLRKGIKDGVILGTNPKSVPHPYITDSISEFSSKNQDLDPHNPILNLFLKYVYVYVYALPKLKMCRESNGSRK